MWVNISATKKWSQELSFFSLEKVVQYSHFNFSVDKIIKNAFITNILIIKTIN